MTTADQTPPAAEMDIAAELRKSRGLTPEMPASEMAERIARCQELVREAKLDAILLWSGGSWKAYYVRYLANFINPFPIAESFLVVPASGDPLMMVDRDWFVGETREMTNIEDVVTFPYIEFDWQLPELIECFKDVFERRGGRVARVGLAMRDIPATYYVALQKALPETEFVDIAPLLNDLVAVKTEYDKSRMHEAATIANEAMRAAIEACAQGVPDYEIGVAHLRATLANGGEIPNPDHHLYTGAGNEMMSNVRSYFHTGRPLERGDMFWIDMGICYRGYYMDFCRTVCIGEPSDEQQRIFDLVLDTHGKLYDLLAPGVTGTQVWQLGYDLMAAHGYQDSINHVWLGHGTGVKTSEPPFFFNGEPRKIQAGSFVTIEPGLLLPGIGMATIEDVIYIDEGHKEILTTIPRHLHVR